MTGRISITTIARSIQSNIARLPTPFTPSTQVLCRARQGVYAADFDDVIDAVSVLGNDVALDGHLLVVYRLVCAQFAGTVELLVV